MLSFTFDFTGQAFVSPSHIGRPEPVYGPRPKFDPYVDEQGNKPKKYLSTPWPTKVASVSKQESIPMSSGAPTNPATTITATKKEVSEVVEDINSIPITAPA